MNRESFSPLRFRSSMMCVAGLLAVAVLAGCGGGGGSSSGGGGGITQPGTVTGTVISSQTDAVSGKTVPVAGAIVQLAGTTAQTTTAVDGTFSFTNVPAGSINLTISAPPNSTLYYSYPLYNGVVYGQDKFGNGCPVPIPAASRTGIVIQLLSQNSGPPPVPGACPAGT